MLKSKANIPELTPCPCGNPAAWYRIVLVPITKRDGAEVVAVDDFYDDLCEKCFVETVAPYDRTGWVNINDYT